MSYSFSDIHCHLCAGLDDGPKTLDEAVEMCRMASQNGTRRIVAVGHQNEQWPKSHRESILAACDDLTQRLRTEQIAIDIVPAGEVLITPDLLQHWSAGQLLSLGDFGKHLLVELPHSVAIDVSGLFQQILRTGVRPILAHPERHTHLIEDVDQVERLVTAGGLLQINAGSLVDAPASRRSRLRDWFQRRLVHLVGSDGHRLKKRLPIVLEAFHTVVTWVGEEEALRIFRDNGQAVFEGKELSPIPYVPRRKRSWFAAAIPWWR